ncbi:MAG TPA: nucleotidyl transferase AbiEii/AbiGii toxin family protein [Desulfitobacteriaceae bacterium]|nr:nucleotidyl transferase AbiEii/AbiGii toxin family protein [Desulfitobacteriaceae bacterium]
MLPAVRPYCLTYDARATKDIDFLARQLSNTPGELVNIFKKVCAIESNDAVRFDSITADRIKENTEYEGIRLKVTGYLDKSRYVLQFDIGFGDVVVPKPVAMDYPSLLDMDHLKINAYTPFPYPDKRYHKTCYNPTFTVSIVN